MARAATWSGRLGITTGHANKQSRATTTMIVILFDGHGRKTVEADLRARKKPS